MAHAVLAAHAVLDITFISGMRLRVLHIYIPMVFGLVYGIFSSIYDLSGGMSPHGDTYIYKVRRWSFISAWLGNTGVMSNSGQLV